MNEQQQILLQRLKEAEISLNRFFEVKTDKAPAEGKGYIEHLRTPEEMDKAGIANWGMMGGNFLVPIDIDKQEMYDLLMKVLPPTLEGQSARRTLPHLYYLVWEKTGRTIPNKVLHIPGDFNEKGQLNGAGEIRVGNQYVVAPGTHVDFIDKKTKEHIIGDYIITKNRPIAKIDYDDFMNAVLPYLGGNNGEQKITTDEMKKGVGSGFRHAKTMSYAYHLIANVRLGETLTFNELKRFGAACTPPLEDEAHFTRAINAAINHEAKATGKTEEYYRTGAELKIIPELMESDPDAKGKTPNDEKSRESQADRIYKLFVANCNVELFHDQNKQAYARIPLDEIDGIHGIPESYVCSTLTKNIEGEEKAQADTATKVSGNCVIASIASVTTPSTFDLMKAAAISGKTQS